MTELFTYLLKAAVINAVILAFYYFSLRKTTKFRLMRGVLLSAMLLPLILPLVPYDTLFAYRGKSSLPAIIITLPAAISSSEISTNRILMPNLSELLYYLVSTIFLLGMLVSVSSIIYKRFHSEKLHTQFGKILLDKNTSSPFSFFQWVFLSHKYLQHPQLDILLKHEFTHVKERHSIDRIISAIFRSVLWFSPFAHITANLLTDVHEYQADDMVIREHRSRSEYSDLILSFYLSSKTTRGVTNNFSFNIKNRILMINNFNTARINLTRVITGLCISLLFITLTAMVRIGSPEIIKFPDSQSSELDSGSDDTTGPTPNLTRWVNESDIKGLKGYEGNSVISFWVESNGSVEDYNISMSAGDMLDAYAISTLKKIESWQPASVNGKPIRYQVNIPFEFSRDGKVKVLFNGGVFIEDFKANDQKPEQDRGPLYPGGDEARMDYIIKNAVYPADAKKAGIEGTVYVQFVIDEKGKVRNAKVLKSVYPSMDKIALDAVAKMPDWKPAIKDGKPVSYEMTMPIAFKLSDKKDKSGEVKSKATFTEIDNDNIPKFPGGFEAYSKYFQSVIKYTPEALKDSITGTVFISFIVKQDGSISDAKVLRGLGHGLDEIALEAVKNMPHWIPGVGKDGKPVDTDFNIPVKFALKK